MTATDLFGEDNARQLERLLDLRDRLRQERAQALTPAVDHSLRLAEAYLHLGISACGCTEELFPEETAAQP